MFWFFYNKICFLICILISSYWILAMPYLLCSIFNTLRQEFNYWESEQRYVISCLLAFNIVHNCSTSITVITSLFMCFWYYLFTWGKSAQSELLWLSVVCRSSSVNIFSCEPTGPIQMILHREHPLNVLTDIPSNLLDLLRTLTAAAWKRGHSGFS